MLINNRVEEPYSRLPPDGPLPFLSKSIVKSQLTKNYINRKKYSGDPKLTISEQTSPINNEKKESLINKQTINNKKKNNTINTNLRKRAKTPNYKRTVLKNKNTHQSYKILNNNVNKDKEKDNNYYNDIDKESNINKNNNIIIDNNNNEDKNNKNDFDNEKNNYCYYNDNNDEDHNLNCCDNNIYDNNELNILKETISKLEEELNKKEKIIELQREERVKLTLKVEELENMLDSIKSTKK